MVEVFAFSFLGKFLLLLLPLLLFSFFSGRHPLAGHRFGLIPMVQITAAPTSSTPASMPSPRCRLLPELASAQLLNYLALDSQLRQLLVGPVTP
jgi:hypothetical protein